MERIFLDKQTKFRIYPYYSCSWTSQFEYGHESTSHIEQLWSVLKTIFRTIYLTIPCINFTLFLKEIECRYLISNKNDDAKIKELLDLFDYVSATSKFNLYYF